MKCREFLVSLAAMVVGSRAAGSGVATDFQPQIFAINTNPPPGQIHINTAQRFLYLTLGNQEAIRCGVAVGAQRRAFKGRAVISRRAEWPSWTPTANMIRLEPQVYGAFAAGLSGRHPQNPMGSRALYLYRNGRDTLFRIHGTHQPWTIGQSLSSGCIRLTNVHVADLYARVSTGTQVFVA